jgi:hypothetical protein
MFNNLFDAPSSSSTPDQPINRNHNPLDRRSTPLTPLTPPVMTQNHAQHSMPPTQPDLLTRLKSCCHLSDSHVVNDPGLLIFATRLCQSFPCSFAGAHPEHASGSDGEHLTLDDAWRALKGTLDPGGEADGENRINTGRMAAEMVVRAAHSRGSGTGGGWIVCMFREGMSIKRGLVAGLIQGLGGKFD